MKKTVFHVLDELKSKLKIEKFYLHYYPNQSLVQDRILLNEKEKEILEKALIIKKSTCLPFWESVFLNFFENEYISSNLLESVLLHNHKDVFDTSKLCDIMKDVNQNYNVNISIDSKIKINNKNKHLFFIDFHIPTSEKNLKVARGVLETLNVKGYILNSGESYHFISSKPYAQTQMTELLIKTLFFSPIVDKSWVAHQLLEKSSSLRVSSKHGTVPFLEMEV